MYLAWKAYRRHHPKVPRNPQGGQGETTPGEHKPGSTSEQLEPLAVSRSQLPPGYDVPEGTLAGAHSSSPPVGGGSSPLSAVTSKDVKATATSYRDLESVQAPPLVSEAASTPPVASSSQTSLMWKVTLVIALVIPVFLETLDYTVVATAQPHIASVFNHLELQSYIGTAYLLSSTVFLPLFASLADIYGRHSALQISLFFFLIGSAISTGAQNMAMVLAGRGIAGVGAAGLLSVVRIIMADSGSLNDNNWQVTILFLLYAIGFCVGPVIGGSLVSANWRWVFGINLPCCAVSIVLCLFLLRKKTKRGMPSERLPTYSESQRETQIQKLLRVDWIGTFFFVSGGILFLLALNWGSTEQWNSAKVIVSFIVGGCLFIVCLLWEYVLERAQERPSAPSSRVLWAEPMLPLAVFRSYDVCTVQFASFCSGMVMLVMFYFVAIFMTIVTGYSPTKAGIQLVYFAPGMGGGSIISIQLIKRFRQPKYPIIFGSIIVPVALGLISMGMNENKQNLVNGFMVMAGVGIGMSAGPLAIHARFSLPDNRVAVVSALTLFFRSLGGTVGLAQCAAVMNGRVSSFLRDLVDSGQLSASDASALLSASQQNNLSSLQGIDSLPSNIQGFVRDAYKSGTRWSFISLIPWCGVSFFLVLFLSKIPDTDKELREQKRAERDQGEQRAEDAVQGDKGEKTAEALTGKEPTSVTFQKAL